MSSNGGAPQRMFDLTFDRVSKRYLVRREAEGEQTLHPWLRKLRALRRKPEEFWALRNVSFGVARGETLGIIGHNGAGKSTILKLLSNITSPTEGEISINGRLSALIEVGSGFHPELTGRENIFLNGAILGMRRSEIAEKLDSITDFAGVRPFLDVPVKRFSSGMYVRLGFSIAAHLDPDILLLDEVLAVGDAAFQEKCLNRIAELKQRGTTIVFISHDLAAVERICDRVILMRQGEIAAEGRPSVIIAQYQSQAQFSTLNREQTPVANDSAEIAALTFRTIEGEIARSFRTGGPLLAQVDFVCRDPLGDVVFDVFIVDVHGEVACQLSTEASGNAIWLQTGSNSLTFSCDEVGLLPGIYHANVSVKTRGAPEAIHWQYHAAMLRVDRGKVTRGVFFQPTQWRLDSDSMVSDIALTDPGTVRPARTVAG